MSTICLVSCTSRKTDFPTSAENLYRSALFDSASSYAKARSDAWFILSAKFGLLAPYEHVSPYDESLHSMDRDARYAWARSVFRSLSKILKTGDRVIFLAGKLYREHLESMLASLGMVTAAPLSELGIGSQVGWLQRLGKERARIEDLDRLYSLLDRLANGVGGRRFLGSSSAKSNWPDKGLYFFFEPTQFRMLSPFDLRVVRVGTHGVSTGIKELTLESAENASRRREWLWEPPRLNIQASRGRGPRKIIGLRCSVSELGRWTNGVKRD